MTSRGDTVWVEISESPLRRLDGRDELQVVVLRDVTERKVLQQQLFHAQKMESVGRLAGGIAHDFNNVLAVMRGQVELLQDDLEVLESARARIDSVQRATDRAAALTDDLMAFSRQRVDEPEPFDLHELLHGVRELLHQVLGDGVTLELELERDRDDDRRRPQPPRAGRPQPGGERARRDAGGRPRHHHDAQRARAVARARAARRRHRRGDGSPRHARASSKPFFTTKPPGFGTGLGLSTTDDIVRAAGGTIDVDSRRGHGTTFTLTFPRARRPRSIRDPPRSTSSTPTSTSTTMRRPCSWSTTSPTCARWSPRSCRAPATGCSPPPTATPPSRCSSARARPVDLLVTDVVMPVMSGTDLAARVTDRSPTTRVLFVSGFVPAGSPSLRGAPLVAKPLHRAELLDAVHTAPRRRRLTHPPNRQGTKR